MKPKDTRAIFFYLITTICLWQLGVSLKNILTSSYMQVASAQNPYISFVFAKNTGGAFSMFEQSGLFLAIFAFAALIAVFMYVYKKTDFNEKFKLIGAVIFSAGILGNLAERIYYGYVIDYIKLNFINFAIFNVFDVMICTSVFIFLAYTLFGDILSKKSSKNE